MAIRRPLDDEEKVEANLTAMLDLIFNILAFFVITFSPPKPERNFDVSLPPPKIEEVDSDSSELPISEENLFEDVNIILGANPDGSLASIHVEGRPIAPMTARQLAKDLQLFGMTIGGEPLEAATIFAHPKLKYRHLIEAVDACHSAKIQKISFAESGGGDG